MKKKILGIVVSVFAMALILTAVGYGTLMYLRNKNVEETGNVLGVSWYNETDTEFTITTKQQLFEFAKLSDYYTFKNQTVKLGADIVINEGNAEDWAEKAPKTRWTPISGFAGRFDGQGHTISGLYAKGHETPTALFVNADYSCSIKNVSLVNSLFKTSGNAGVASFLSNGGGKLSQLYSDAIFVHKGEKVGGIVSDITAQSTLEECWFDGSIEATSRNIGGIVDHISNGARVTIKHSLFSGDINQKYEFNGTRTGGIVGRVAGAATVVINDCLTTGTIKTGIESEIGAMIGKSESGVSVTVTDTYLSKDTHSALVGTKSGTYSGSGIGLYGQYLVGTKAYQWTTLDFTKYWAAIEGDTPILKCFAKDITPLSVEGLAKEFDTSWYNEYTSKFELKTRQQLYGFYYLSTANTFAGQTVALGNDIVINEGKATKWEKNTPDYLWYPIFQFAGIFDGQGHTISGLCLKEDGAYQGYNGLFGRADKGSVIKNVLLKNSYLERMFDEVKQAAFLGSIAGETRGIIDSVYSDAILKSNGVQVGGIVGRMNYMDSNYEMTVTVNNCWFDGEITGIMNQKMGGIVSYVGRGSNILMEGTKLAITHCLNTGTINNARKSNKEGFDGAAYTGGILGFDNAGVNLTMEDCLNAGVLNLAYKGYAGSITGRIAKSGSIYTIKDTYTTWESLTYNSDLPLAIHDITGTMIGGPANMPIEQLTGLNAYRYSTLDFKNYWSVVDGSTPVLKTFAGKVGVKTQSTSGTAKKVDMSWYKANKTEYVLDSVEDLYGFYVMSTYEDFVGKTIKLGTDISFNTGNAADWKTNAPENEWFPIGVNRTNYRFAGTFDGQGHTISGLYLSDNSEWVNYSGFFGVTATESVVKNLKITNSYFERLNKAGESAMMGSVAGEVQGTIQNVYSDAIIYTDGNQVGGIAGRMVYADKEGKTTTLIDNCWFDGEITGVMNQKMGGITAYAGRSGAQAEVTDMAITNCLFTGIVGNNRTTKKDGLGGQYIGGIFGYDIATVNMKIDNCLSAGTIDTVYDGYVGSVIGMINKSGSVFTVTNTYGTDECWNVKGTPKGIHVNNGTIIGGVATIPESMVTDVKAYQYTSLDFTNTWAAVENSTPELKWMSGAGKSISGYEQLVDVSWYDKDKKTYILTDAKDLYGFREVSTYTDFAGKTVKLGGNITVNSETVDGSTVPTYDEWAPIGQRYLFAGTFDGQGNTISGIYCKRDTGYMGLFSTIPVGTTIKDFYLKNSYFECTSTTTDVSRVGSIVGDLRGSLEGIYSNATVVTKGANQVGGLVGIANYQDLTHETQVNIKNCWFDGKVIGSGTAYQMGGIAGSVGRGSGKFTASKSIINFTNCLMSGDIINEGTNTYQYTGGIFGDSNKANLRVNITECLVSGTITTSNHEGVASIVGALRNTSSVCTLTDTYATNESYEGNLLVDQDIVDQTEGKVTNNNSGFAAKEDLISRGTYFVTSLDFENNWSARNTDVPAPKYFIGDGKLVAKADVFTLSREYTDWYDGSGDYVLTTAEDLYGFAYLAKKDDFAGEKISLGNSITLNTLTVGESVKDWETNPPEYKWYPIGTADGTSAGKGSFAGTFDGQGYTISGLYIKNTSGENNAGMFRNTQIGSVIKNFKLTDSYIESNGGRTGSIVGDLRGALDSVYSDAIVVTSGNQAGGLVGVANFQKGCTKVVISNSWFDGELTGAEGVSYRMGGIVGVGACGGSLSNQYIEITNCLMTGTITRKGDIADGVDYQSIGGIIGDNNAASIKLTITDCLVDGEIVVDDSTAVGALIGAQYSGTCTVNSLRATTDSFEDLIGERPNKTSVVPARGEGTYDYVTDADLVSYNAYFTTGFDFETGWSAREADVPVPKAFVGDTANDLVTTADVVAIDTDWENDTIYTLDEFYGFAYLSYTSADKGAIYAGKTIKLGADITVNEGTPLGEDGIKGTEDDWKPVNKWYPIGSNATNTAGAGAYAGNFDGQGHTISGLYIVDSEKNVGIFRNTKVGTTITNFQLTNSYVENTSTNSYRTGSIVGDLRGTLSHVYSDALVVSAGVQAGGLVGIANYQDADNTQAVSITNCWFDGTVEGGESANQLGGIVGSAARGAGTGVINITNCLVTGKVVGRSTGSYQYVGGFVGDTNKANFTLNIAGCLMAGEIDVTNHNGVASMIGGFRHKSSKCYIENSYAVNGYLSEDNSKLVVDQSITGQSDKGTVYYKNYAGVESTTTAPLDSIFYNKEDISGYNVFFDSDLTTKLDFVNTWVARKTDVPALKYFVSTDTQSKVVPQNEVASIDTSFMTDGTYTIDNLDEFYGFAYLAYTSTDLGEVYKDKTIKLASDITLNQGTPLGEDGIEGTADDWSEKPPVNRWYPIGSKVTNATFAGAFAGNFDGQGHTISGLYVKNTTGEDNIGMFRNLKAGKSIKNFKLVDSYVESSGARVGSIVGDARGNVENIYSNAIVRVGASNGGGIVGVVMFSGSSSVNVSISNCWYDGHLIGAEDVSFRLGGIVAIAGSASSPSKKTLNITDCLVTGTITRKGALATGSNSDASLRFQGIGGFISDNNGGSIPLVISNSLMAGNIDVDNNTAVGALIGAWTKNTVTLTNVWAIEGTHNVLIGERPNNTMATIASGSTYDFIDEPSISGPLSDEAIANLFGENSAWMPDTITNKTLILKYFEEFWRVQNSAQSRN